MTKPRETTPRQTNPRETYPPGVTCFIDTERADVDAAAAFYGGLFGWTLEDRLPPDAPARFLMAELDGLSVAGIASASSEGAAPAWNTYISVESADATVPRVKAAGGSVLTEPFDVGPAGRMAAFADPEGAAFRVWQAGRTHGAQLVNAPGAWNWSDLETRDLEAAKAFYTAVFGWEYELVDLGQGPSAMIRVPAYGEHLEALSPGTLARHKELGGCRRPATRTARPAGRSRSRSPTPTTPRAAPASSAARSWSSPSTCRTSGWPSSGTRTA
jgi:predicted enzyme related to lactoylglutathione lyase